MAPAAQHLQGTKDEQMKRRWIMWQRIGKHEYSDRVWQWELKAYAQAGGYNAPANLGAIDFGLQANTPDT
jgi:hypothetical protein